MFSALSKIHLHHLNRYCYVTMSKSQIASFAFEIYSRSIGIINNNHLLNNNKEEDGGGRKAATRKLPIDHIVRLVCDTHEDSHDNDLVTEKNVTDAFKEFHDKTKTGYVTIDEFVNAAIKNEILIMP